MTQPPSPRIAVVGAGLIGARHVRHFARAATLDSIVDPSPQAQSLARQHNAAWFESVEAMLAASRPDGLVIATPTQLHAEQAMAAVRAGLPALIEKPVASDADEAAALVAAARHANVPLLVGHHRRYNPIIASAHNIINDGQLGSLIAVNAMCWLYKPDDYFSVPWRRRKGAGPVLTNLIHDIDLLRHLCGNIRCVQAVQSSAQRQFDTEDTAAIVLEFESGVLGTVTVSDTIVSPWSWELTAGENRAYPHTRQSSYLIGGTRASLSLPDLGLWHNGSNPGWWQPMLHETRPAAAVGSSDTLDPLALQAEHFVDVITNGAAPKVSGAEGLATLRVIEAIFQAAESRKRTTIKQDDV